jgi:hypothetical protein
MSEYVLNLNKVLKGSTKSVELTLYVNDSPHDCYLTGIAVPNLPKAEGMEKELSPQKTDDDGFGAPDNTVWTLKRPSGIVVEDEQENEITISVHSCVLKTLDGTNAMAKIALGENGEDILTTPNWKD